VRFAGVVEPRSYELPWDQHTAENLQQAQEEAGEGGTVRMRFERSYDPGEKLFYPAPQEAMPPKPAPDEGPAVLEQDA
jgi:hypothetical protein